MRRRSLTFISFISTGALVALLVGCGSSSTVEPAAASGSPAPQPPATEQPTTEPPAGAQGDAPAASTQPAPAPSLVWPDEQCSSANAGLAEALPGPAPALALRSESANSPLPDVAVRRLNCGPAWVNLKNEVPADRPLLVWFWAPH
jgi:hypothetical protein